MNQSPGLPNGSSRTQGGFSLIVALIMLIVIIMLGISGSQMSINEERGARNVRDRQLAFQAAEAALKDAEYEILNPASPACAVSGQFGKGRQGSQICFNESSGVYFGANCSAGPGAAQGLCAYNSLAPAYLSSNVNFLSDAKGSGNGNTVPYGRFSLRTFPSQATVSGQAVPIYLPRYIIEIVPKNVSIDSCTAGGPTGCKSMFRVTAMGFGANANSQVVLQSIVSTAN